MPLHKFSANRNQHIFDRYLLAGFAVMAGILLFYLSPLVLNLNTTMLGATGDALKNFYTLAYYVKYDSGLLFSGMLYPYGEHISFTDNQPLTALTLNFIQHHLFDVSPYLLGIVNALLLLNFFLCAWLLYKILSHFELPAAYSIACAILITFISPTLYRIGGHYSLSYSFILPLVLYLIIRYEAASDSGKTWIAVALCAVSSLSALLHPYWVIISAMVIALFAIIKGAWEKKIPVKILLAGLFSPLLFKIFLLLTDPIADRPQDPYGAGDYAAWTNSVFFPQFDSYKKIRHTLNVSDASFEALSYVGIPGILFAIYLLFRILVNAVKRKFDLLPGPPVLKYLFCAGLLILLLSMFIPFRFGLQDFYYRIPFLNQFRSLGRFAWAFYFIFCIYYAYGFGTMLKRRQISNAVRIAAVILLFGVWSTDLHFTLSKVKQNGKDYGGINVLEHNNTVAGLLAGTGYQPSDFQAVLPLPLVAEGSEKLWLLGGWMSKAVTLPYSYQTGTPVLGCLMSRTSLSRTLHLVSLTGSDYCEKTILHDIKSALPFLVVAKAGEPQKNFSDKYFQITADKEVALYVLPVDSLKKIKAFTPDFVDTIKQQYSFRGNYYTNDTSNSIFHWTNGSMEQLITTPDATPQTVNEEKFEIEVNASHKEYSLSCWINITPFGNKVPFFRINEYDSTGTRLREKSTGTDRVSTFDVFQDWVRFEDTIHLNTSTQKISLEIYGTNSIIDHLQFRPLQADVVCLPEKLPGKVYLNNFVVTIKD